MANAQFMEALLNELTRVNNENVRVNNEIMELHTKNDKLHSENNELIIDNADLCKTDIELRAKNKELEIIIAAFIKEIDSYTTKQHNVNMPPIPMDVVAQVPMDVVAQVPMAIAAPVPILKRKNYDNDEHNICKLPKIIENNDFKDREQLKRKREEHEEHERKRNREERERKRNREEREEREEHERKRNREEREHKRNREEREEHERKRKREECKELDMQKTNPFVKASLCLYNIMNKCRHGINCRYAHHTSELKSCPDGKKCNFPKCIFTKH